MLVTSTSKFNMTTCGEGEMAPLVMPRVPVHNDVIKEEEKEEKEVVSCRRNRRTREKRKKKE